MKNADAIFAVEAMVSALGDLEPLELGWIPDVLDILRETRWVIVNSGEPSGFAQIEPGRTEYYERKTSLLEILAELDRKPGRRS